MWCSISFVAYSCYRCGCFDCWLFSYLVFAVMWVALPDWWVVVLFVCWLLILVWVCWVVCCLPVTSWFDCFDCTGLLDWLVYLMLLVSLFGWMFG